MMNDNYEIIEDNNIRELIQDKTVAFIGPAPTLIGSGMGEVIDSYDVVCRVNSGFNVPQNIKLDYGSRCDLLFHSCDDHSINDLKKLLNEYAPPYFCLPLEDSRGKNNLRKDKFRIIEEYGTYCYHAGNKLRLKIQEKVQDNPNTGFVSIFVILNFEPKNIFLGGFSFYKGNKYYDGYLNKYLEKIHSQTEQINFFKNIYKNNSEIIDVDYFLQNNILDNNINYEEKKYYDKFCLKNEKELLRELLITREEEKEKRIKENSKNKIKIISRKILKPKIKKIKKQYKSLNSLEVVRKSRKIKKSNVKQEDKKQEDKIVKKRARKR